MADKAKTYDWAKIAQNPKFIELHRRKTTFLYSLWAFSACFYFLLLLGAGYTPGLFSVEVFGNINVGYLMALGQFLVTFWIAIYYGKVADREFDQLTQELLDQIQ